jgi:hypothetical protein
LATFLQQKLFLQVEILLAFRQLGFNPFHVTTLANLDSETVRPFQHTTTEVNGAFVLFTIQAQAIIPKFPAPLAHHGEVIQLFVFMLGASQLDSFHFRS